MVNKPKKPKKVSPSRKKHSNKNIETEVPRTHRRFADHRLSDDRDYENRRREIKPDPVEELVKSKKGKNYLKYGHSHWFDVCKNGKPRYVGQFKKESKNETAQNKEDTYQEATSIEVHNQIKPKSDKAPKIPRNNTVPAMDGNESSKMTTYSQMRKKNFKNQNELIPTSSNQYSLKSETANEVLKGLRKIPIYKSRKVIPHYKKRLVNGGESLNEISSRKINSHKIKNFSQGTKIVFRDPVTELETVVILGDFEKSCDISSIQETPHCSQQYKQEYYEKQNSYCLLKELENLNFNSGIHRADEKAATCESGNFETEKRQTYQMEDKYNLYHLRNSPFLKVPISSSSSAKSSTHKLKINEKSNLCRNVGDELMLKKFHDMPKKQTGNDENEKKNTISEEFNHSCDHRYHNNENISFCSDDKNLYFHRQSVKDKNVSVVNRLPKLENLNKATTVVLFEDEQSLPTLPSGLMYYYSSEFSESDEDKGSNKNCYKRKESLFWKKLLARFSWTKHKLTKSATVQTSRITKTKQLNS